MWSTSGSHISLAVKMGSTPSFFPAWIPMKWFYNTDWRFMNEYVTTVCIYIYIHGFKLICKSAGFWLETNIVISVIAAWSSSGTLVPNLLKSCSWVDISQPQQVVQIKEQKETTLSPKILLNAVEIVYGSWLTYQIVVSWIVTWGSHNITLIILGFYKDS